MEEYQLSFSASQIDEKLRKIDSLAEKNEIPKNISDLVNDSGFLSSIPSEYITENELNAKKYLTSYTETDPTVPSWAKQSTKPSYTKSEVGLGNVNNTSDANKPVSTAQATAIADAKKAGTDAQSNLNTHTSNKSNPHGVTKAQVGLSNVDNVKQYSASNPPVVVQSGAPKDTSVIWVDTDDESIESVVTVAKTPEFVYDISACTDTSKVYLLPNGHLCAYMTKEVVTEGSTVPNFTNLYDTSKGAYIKDGYRYSASSGGFKQLEGSCAIYIPLGQSWKHNAQFVLRVRTAKKSTAAYAGYMYALEATNAEGHMGGDMIDGFVESGDDLVITTTMNQNDNINTFSSLVFNVASGSVDESNLIVTFNEEITYSVTEGKTEIVTEWTDTGIEYVQPSGSSENNSSSNTSATSAMGALSFASYPPSPQLPGDGSDESDFNVDDVATSEVYAYMDALWNRYRTYMVKQNLGKDASGQYDYYRYVFSKAYWRAWYKENYPKMYAWKNGNTVIYSVSVSPRVGDTMYSTPYVGTVYKTVTAVNSETIGVASTRTVNGLVFTRYADGDVEPTIVYTCPFAISASYKGRTYTDTFAASSSVKEFTHEYIVDNKDVKYFRYPFEDKKLDKSSLFPVFILANEHGNNGDSMIPSVTVMRMLKDMCSSTNNLFLQWLKENAIVTVIPLGNPYGGYNNSNGVNINRNYDTPGWAGSNTDPQGGTKEDGSFGSYAGSEIETQYIMNTIQQCKAKTAMSCHGRGVPTDVLGEYNSSAMFQGCGFDAERMWKVEEALFSMYNFGFTPAWHTIIDDSSNNYLNAGKSPSYIEYAGAVGGLIEIDDHEVGTLDSFTPLAMEQAYAEVLLTLQNWVEEALIKASN